MEAGRYAEKGDRPYHCFLKSRFTPPNNEPSLEDGFRPAIAQSTDSY